MAANAKIPDGGIFPRGFNVETPFPFPLRRADELVELCYGTTLREPDRVSGDVSVYPPDKRAQATETVLRQAELLCADWAM